MHIGRSTAPLLAIPFAGLLGALAFATTIPLPPCLFLALTRHPCPGCGTTTALKALARADLGAALHASPLAAIVAVVFLIAAPLLAIFVMTQKRFTLEISDRALRFAIVAAVAANWAFLLATR